MPYDNTSISPCSVKIENSTVKPQMSGHITVSLPNVRSYYCKFAKINVRSDYCKYAKCPVILL